MKRLLPILFVACGIAQCGFGAASPITVNRRPLLIPGVTLGVSNGIPSGTVWTNADTAGADPTGATDSKTVFQTLLNQTYPVWPAVVQLSAGRYEVGSQISKNPSYGGIIFRGVGTNTVIIATNGFLICDSQTFFDFTVDENIVKGQTNFNARPGTDLSPYVGKTARISVANDPNNDPHAINVMNVNTYEGRDLKQYVQIVAVHPSNLSNVTVWPPLGMHFTNIAAIKIGVNTSPICEFVGFENMRLLASNDVTHCPAVSANFQSWFGVRNWWLKNVRIENCNGFFLSLLGGMFNEVRSCDWVSSVSGANTAVIITTGESSDYFYDNYSIGGSPFVEGNGLSCSVGAYNFVTNAISNDFHVGNPFDNHAGHSWGNLWEGNWGSMYQSDSYFGSSHWFLLFRNYFSGYDLIKTGIPRCIDLGRWSQQNMISGNVLGAPAGASNFYLGAWSLFPQPVYMVTNQNFSGTQPQILRIGYPYPGNTAYGSNGAAMNTPGTDWRYPGGFATRTFTISNGTTGPDGTNKFYGDFSKFTCCGSGTYVYNQGGVIYWLLQRSVAHGGTNYYYSPASSTTAGDGTSITLSSFIAVTNGDLLFEIGADSFPALTHSYTNGYIINGNYDTSNATVTASADYFETNSYYLPNGGTKPSWWLDENGNSMPVFPPVVAANGVAGIYSTNWPAYRRNFFAPAGGGGAGGTTGTAKRPGNRGQGKKKG